jgi:hypothetical protein
VVSIIQQIVSREIDRALTKHYVATNGRIRAEIEGRIQWDAVSVSSVSVCDDRNRVLPVDAYLDELRDDPRFAAEFPPQPARVSRSDTAKLRDNFNQICDGTVVVE